MCRNEVTGDEAAHHTDPHSGVNTLLEDFSLRGSLRATSARRPFSMGILTAISSRPTSHAASASLLHHLDFDKDALADLEEVRRACGNNRLGVREPFVVHADSTLLDQAEGL